MMSTSGGKKPSGIPVQGNQFGFVIYEEIGIASFNPAAVLPCPAGCIPVWDERSEDGLDGNDSMKIV